MPIVSGNTQLRDLVIAGNDGDFAERVQLRPKSTITGRADTARDIMEFRAILRTAEEKVHTLGSNQSEGFSTEIRTGGARLFVDVAKFSAIEFNKSDVIKALERPGEPVFEVLSVDIRSHRRLIVELGKKS